MSSSLRSERSTPDDSGAHAGSAEISAALTQAMRSLENLASNCRSRGVDPMALVMSMMSGRDNGGFAAPQTVAKYDALSSRTPAPPSDAELARRSRDLVEALDRGNVAAVDAALAPGFLYFAGGSGTDRDVMLASIKHRTSPWFIAKRTWENEHVVRREDTLVFTGKAREVQGGNDKHGGYIHDVEYLLQWVRAGDAWRVQLLTWRKHSTDRDLWNDTFHKGHGFSREPNHLLVDRVEGMKPGAALELAMGQGRNALYLASKGWEVTGVDISDEALRIAREQAVERNLALETINANIDEWDFGKCRFDLVTMIYADQVQCIEKIKESLRKDGLLVIEGWAKESPDSPIGFGEGQLAKLFEGYEIERDEIVDDAPDWAWGRGTLVRFVARKK